ncbi:hypothetical protein O9H85_08175 [Paenibacillus filicis]|uniref:Uncharacterized protein n=1 Tax=Paenibacillus gyeongsangnamensis TaxID=3388067 RepID=A0ABT4Q6A7_9BACL|nr:hypothetical protein [Paenibacillus filicis]MCZ8512409.1 hypothetical protein [Paenibacillus filicis]
MANKAETETQVESSLKEVTLKDSQKGTHRIFTREGIAEFNDGIANVSDLIEKELKATGQIK